MPITDYSPQGGDNSNLSTWFRNVFDVPVRKRVVIAVLVVFGLFLVFVLGLILSKSEDRLALTAVPIHPLGYIPLTRSINVSVDPCSNFYDFTCGLWAQNKEVSERNDLRVTTFEMLQTYFDWKKRNVFENSQVSSDLPHVVNDAIRFFKFCDSENDSHYDVNYLKIYFKQIMGSWPVVDPKEFNPSHFDWSQTSALLLKTLGIRTIMDVFSIVDDNNSSRRILYLKPPVLKQSDYSPEHSSTTPQMLYSVITTLNNQTLSDIPDSMESIMKSEIQWFRLFSNLPSKPERLRTTLKELKEKLPEFDWMFYFRTIMNDTLNKLETDISEEDAVLVENFKIIENAINFFNSGNLSKVETANLFGWLALQEIMLLIPGVAVKYSELLHYDVNELKEIRKDKCYETLLELYLPSVDYLFIKNSSLSCLSDGKLVVHYLKNALRNILQFSDWLDDSTKRSAILKLDAMQSIIGFRSYLSNKTEFDAMFEGHPSVKPSPLETYFDINLYFVSCLVSQLKSDEQTYIMPRSVAHVSAYYDPQKNIFTLPLSMYNPPIYYSQGPLYLNFGALGAVVGHEIMHGFDKLGCQRGETGSYKKWWTRKSIEIFEQRSECFAEQHSSFLNNTAKSKRSDQSINEDIADSEGLRFAYLAYQQWIQEHSPEEMYSVFSQKYSSEQMFFIAFGSIWCSKIDPLYKLRLPKGPHSFPEYRVNSAVSNSEYFSKAFNCPKGSPMNPERKCTIW